MKKLLRQEIKSYTPEWNSKCSIIVDLIIMASSIWIGVVLLYYSKRHIEIEVDYTNCIPNQDNTYSSSNKSCKIQFKVLKTIKKPVFVYYKLKNFYLNHRKIIESKNWKELRGEDVNTKSSCEGAYLMGEMFGKNSPYFINPWGHQFSEGDVASPCGLLAKSFFNDTYNITDDEGNYINIDENGIANSYLKNTFFKRRKDYKEKQWIDVENEHFINWMNTETFSTFIKLWGKIYRDLEPGSYYLIVHDNYDIARYDSKKYFVIGNANISGVNNLAGYFFIAVAIYLTIVILIIWAKYLLGKEKKEVSISKLKWI